MGLLHKIREGECITSLSFLYGFFWKTIWDSPENEALRGAERDPNTLLPGDAVTIPNRVPKEVSVATGRKHTFRRRGIPPTLNLQLELAGGPRANEPYSLEIGGQTFTGSTDAEGRIRHYIPPAATKAVLTLTDSGEVQDLQVGVLDPVDQPRGVQQRLANLGFFTGRPDGEDSAQADEAVRAFQEDQGLEATGMPDEAFRAALEQAHGC